MGNKKMNPFKNKNIRIKFYLFCRTHAFEHHRYIVEFYITKLSVQCSLPICHFKREGVPISMLLDLVEVAKSHTGELIS